MTCWFCTNSGRGRGSKARSGQGPLCDTCRAQCAGFRIWLADRCSTLPRPTPEMRALAAGPARRVRPARAELSQPLERAAPRRSRPRRAGPWTDAELQRAAEGLQRMANAGK